jgi:hypothetical protein
MFSVDQTFNTTITKEEFTESEGHIFTVEHDDHFRSVVPSPLAEDFSMEWLDEFSAWSWIVHIRENHVSGKRWAIGKPLDCAKCLWSALGGVPTNSDDEIEEEFLHFYVGTNRYEIWQWFESELNASVATDLMNLQ